MRVAFLFCNILPPGLHCGLRLRRGTPERSLIVERVKAGLRNARAKGKRLGRPRSVVDASKIAVLRSQGLGWKKTAAELGVGVGTLYRLSLDGSKIRERVI
jgi:DNA invertase Pin-like site-specific DNA recombinase